MTVSKILLKRMGPLYLQYTYHRARASCTWLLPGKQKQEGAPNSLELMFLPMP